MKKISKFCVLLLSSFTLISCGGGATDGKEVSPLQAKINTLREGVKLEGSLIQTRKFYTDDTFTKEDPTNRDEADLKAEATVSFSFANNAFNRKVDTKFAGEFVPYCDDTFLKDEHGYAYNEYLGLDNQVKRSYLTSYGNKVSFVSLGFDNPFDSIYERDLTLNEDKTIYSLDLIKASTIFNDLLGFYAAGLVNPGEKCEIHTNAKGDLTRFVYEVTPRYVVSTNTSTQQTECYIVNQKIDLFITESGEDLVKTINPIENATDTTELKNAFTSFDASNIRINIADEQSINNVKSTKYYRYYLDGENVYVKYFDTNNGSPSQIDAENDYILTKNKGIGFYEARGYSEEHGNQWIPSNTTKFGKSSQDKYVYDDFLLNIKNISCDLFTYDSATDSYVCENIAVRDIATNGLQPKAKELRISNLTYAKKASIKIKDGMIYQVTVDYQFVNTFTGSAVKGTTTFKFSNVGNTTLPFDASNNMGGDN